MSSLSTTTNTENTDWDQFKNTLRTLYLEQNLSLLEVRNKMAKTYQLYRSKAQYELQFKKWNFRKNQTAEEWKILAHKIVKRKREQKDSEVSFNGKLISPKKLRKETLRYGSSGAAEPPLQTANSRRLLHTHPIAENWPTRIVASIPHYFVTHKHMLDGTGLYSITRTFYIRANFHTVVLYSISNKFGIVTNKSSIPASGHGVGVPTERLSGVDTVSENAASTAAANSCPPYAIQSTDIVVVTVLGNAASAAAANSSSPSAFQPTGVREWIGVEGEGESKRQADPRDDAGDVKVYGKCTEVAGEAELARAFGGEIDDEMNGESDRELGSEENGIGTDSEVDNIID
ncbi:hypothetical protein G7Y89_g4202 [Cudoniella acicularis]|uniref:Clr5 domain-containing protein n=1 Tax=Cudoniella acicularis TaxID=354080 RepID=A0A8H4W6X9_9HELO|nr:hypothetical protein G7Y89_g4202 [Cudoniella acicularis]